MSCLMGRLAESRERYLEAVGSPDAHTREMQRATYGVAWVAALDAAKELLPGDIYALLVEAMDDLLEGSSMEVAS